MQNKKTFWVFSLAICLATTIAFADFASKKERDRAINQHYYTVLLYVPGVLNTVDRSNDHLVVAFELGELAQQLSAQVWVYVDCPTRLTMCIYPIAHRFRDYCTPDGENSYRHPFFWGKESLVVGYQDKEGLRKALLMSVRVQLQQLEQLGEKALADKVRGYFKGALTRPLSREEEAIFDEKIKRMVEVDGLNNYPIE